MVLHIIKKSFLAACLPLDRFSAPILLFFPLPLPYSPPLCSVNKLSTVQPPADLPATLLVISFQVELTTRSLSYPNFFSKPGVLSSTFDILYEDVERIAL